MDVLKLIHLVKQRPELYESSSVRLLLERKKLWQEIGEELGSPALVCRDRWTNLRKLYRKYLVKKERSRDTISTYKYAEELSFLDPHLGLGQQTTSNEIQDEDLQSLDYCSSVETESQRSQTRSTTVELDLEEKPSESVADFCKGILPLMEKIRNKTDLDRNRTKMEILQKVVKIVEKAVD